MTTLLITAKQNHLIPRETNYKQVLLHRIPGAPIVGMPPGGLLPIVCYAEGTPAFFCAFSILKDRENFIYTSYTEKDGR